MEEEMGEKISAAGKEEMGGRPIHALFVPYPVHGQILPMLHLARTLAARHSSHHLTITLLNSPHHHVRLLSKLRILPLPPPPPPADPPTRWYDDSVPLLPNLRLMSVHDGLPPDFHSDSFIQNTPSYDWKYQLYRSCFQMARRLRHKLLLLQQPSGDSHGDIDPDPPPVSFVVVGTFCDWAIDMAVELGIPSVLFWTQSATVFSIYLHLPDLEAHGVFSQDTRWEDGGGGEEEEKVVAFIAGVPPLRLRDLPKYLQVNDAASLWIVFMQAQLEKVKQHCSAILLNSFESLEEEAIGALQKRLNLLQDEETTVQSCKDQQDLPTVYPIGPVLGERRFLDGGSENEDPEGCLRWLDGRAERSVVYVSFGTLSEPAAPERMEAVVEGIRMSGMAYLWAAGGRGRSFLPPAEAAAAEGLAVEWAPQRAVLAHPSVGAFVTHCGWNSTLEAMREGVPMLTLPLDSDQTTNAMLVTDVWQIGVRIIEERGTAAPVIISREGVAAALSQAVAAEDGDANKKKKKKKRCAEWKAAAAAAEDVERHRHMDAFLRRFSTGRNDHDHDRSSL